MPCESAGHGEIATSSVKSRNELYQTFIRSSVLMGWTEERYQHLWTDPVPARKEMDNTASSYEEHEFVSSVVFGMVPLLESATL